MEINHFIYLIGFIALFFFIIGFGIGYSKGINTVNNIIDPLPKRKINKTKKSILSFYIEEHSNGFFAYDGLTSNYLAQGKTVEELLTDLNNKYGQNFTLKSYTEK